jgi:hypothetical protein
MRGSPEPSTLSRQRRSWRSNTVVDGSDTTRTGRPLRVQQRCAAIASATSEPVARITARGAAGR